MKGIEHSGPKENSKPEATILHNIDIAYTRAEAFTRHLKNPSSETFVTSLYEIDRAFDDKWVQEITDNIDMQALIDWVLPG